MREFLSGILAPFLRLASSSGPLITGGPGSPEGAVTAPVGSQYHRTDGGAGTSVYRKESGTGNTGWVADAATGVERTASFEITASMFAIGQVQRCNSSSAMVATIPAELGVATDAAATLLRQGAGAVSITGASGVTIIAGGNSVVAGTTTIASRGDAVVITRVGTDVYCVSGGSAAA